VYLLVLEKSGERPSIYIGSGTDATSGVTVRLWGYDNDHRVAANVKHALADGYTITHKGLLCWARIPVPLLRFPIGTLFYAMEATFSMLFWSMELRTKNYGFPQLCPWPLDTLEYSRLCTHTSFADPICGEHAGLTPQQIAAKAAEIEKRRKQQQASYFQRRLAKWKALDWMGGRQNSAKQMQPTQRSILGECYDYLRRAGPGPERPRSSHVCPANLTVRRRVSLQTTTRPRPILTPFLANANLSRTRTKQRGWLATSN
jgi:hypothetical protein